MTLASYVLVVCDDRDGENASAGLLYLVMAHGGTALLLVAFLALAERAALRLRVAARRGGRPERRDAHDALHARARGLRRQGRRRAAARLAPAAHPAAPSHVSALMSGVMLKVADLRHLPFRLRPPRPRRGPLPASWGWTVLVAGHGLGRDRRALRAPAARPQAPARVPQRRERRHHPDRRGRGDAPLADGRATVSCWRRWRWRPRSCTRSTTRRSRGCSSSAPAA